MSEATCDPGGRLRRGAMRSLALGSIWLVFLVFPSITLAHAHAGAAHEAFAFAAVGAFVAIYVVLLATLGRVTGLWALAVILILMGLAGALTVLDRADWASLFIYGSAAGALLLPERLAAGNVLLATALAGTLSAAGGGDSSAVVAYTVVCAGIGFLLITFEQLGTRNRELQRARTELAELAVAQERERFARDLHDLLGHSLSVISLKAQLVRRLLERDPAEAERHLRDLEGVARDALGEVRDAVSGYRQPTLEDALDAARLALAAASIDAHIEIAQAAMSPRCEGVLAWAVREGTTNVIRHSGSRNCWIRLRGGASATALEILDDGRRATGANGGGGSGLRGLRERATALAGAVEAGVAGDGGFRLLVTLPRDR